MSDTRLLDGVTIIDLTHVLAGPYATMIMSNLGARVIKGRAAAGRRRRPRLRPVPQGCLALLRLDQRRPAENRAEPEGPRGPRGLRAASRIGRPGLKTDPRSLTKAHRFENVDTLKADLEAVLATRERLDLLDQAGVPSGPLNTLREAVADPQVTARNIILDVQDPVAGPLRIAGNLNKVSGIDDPESRAAARPAPRRNPGDAGRLTP